MLDHFPLIVALNANPPVIVRVAAGGCIQSHQYHLIPKTNEVEELLETQVVVTSVRAMD